MGVTQSVFSVFFFDYSYTELLIMSGDLTMWTVLPKSTIDECTSGGLSDDDIRDWSKPSVNGDGSRSEAGPSFIESSAWLKMNISVAMNCRYGAEAFQDPTISVLGDAQSGAGVLCECWSLLCTCRLDI